MNKLGIFLSAIALFPSAALADVTGVWSRTNVLAEETRIEITMCTTTTYCGTIVYMDVPRLDDRNIENPELRDRPLIGLEIFNDVVEISENQYSGSVYNPEVGLTLTGNVVQIDDNTLQLEGCVNGFCQQDTWIRYFE